MKTAVNIIYVMIVAAICCQLPTKSLKNVRPNESNSYSNIFCGDSVIWRLQLQEGFYNNNVVFIMHSDTIGKVTKANTGGNGCTKIHLTYIRDGNDGPKLYLENMPNYNLVRKIDKYQNDSIDVVIFVDNNQFRFVQHLNSQYRFYGLSYDSLSAILNPTRSEKCFICL